MECPACCHSIILGDDVCEHCGGDLTHMAMPPPRRGRLHEVILEDPISQLNAPRPIILQGKDSVADAVERMRKLRYGSVLVEEGKRLAGIFTEHDLVRHFASRDVDLAKVKLREVMTPNPQTLQEEDSLSCALHRMAVGGYRHIPVVRGGEPVGFISIRGILRYIAENAL
jgi:CBS domain-containing protein